VNCQKFVNYIPKAATILIDDGDIELRVIGKNSGYLECQILNDGQLKSHKSINVPGVDLKLPSIGPRDKEFINLAIQYDLDFIAHSFVRSKQDCLAIQKILDQKKSQIKIIAKIENRQGVDNIDEILDHVYGVMIARGDLGIEIPAEEVPIIQKKLIKKCIERQKPVITATQMLHSMIENPRPTRAEISDVANAIFDGTDAIMLSGETAYGKYPVQSVACMSRVAKRIEAHNRPLVHLPVFKNDNDPITNYLAKSAVLAAQELDAKEIIVATQTGFSAEVIASYRGKTPIFAKAFNPRRMRELSLTYGVNAHLVKSSPQDKQLVHKIFTELVAKKKLDKKDLVIYLSGDTNQNISANFMEICEVGKYILKI